MSLRLWLPLRGDLTNNGLDEWVSGLTDVSIAQANCTVDTNGKIGSCYSFNGSNSYIDINDINFPTIISGDFSICMWVYNNDDGGRSILFGNYGLEGGFDFSIEKLATNAVRFYWNNSPDINLASTLPATEWTHLTITRKGNTVKCYINGSLTKTSTATLNGSPVSTMTRFRLGCDARTGTTVLNGKLNDFRLYDHELSAKEVKEISQALIQHFPLNDFVGNENLLLDTMKDKDQTHTTYNFADFHFSKSLVSGNTYTVTCKINLSEERKHIMVCHSGGTIEIINWDKNNNGVYSGSFVATSNMSSQTSGSGHGYARVYVSTIEGNIQGSNPLSGSGNVEWIKIEEGSVSTPYLPNPADTLYNICGFNGTTANSSTSELIIFDASGYCNNGILSSNRPTLALDSPRYSSCMLFNGTNTFINCGRGAMVKDEITVNVWAYMDNWGSIVDAKGNITSCTEGGGWNFEVGNSNTLQFPVGTGASSNTYKVAAMTNSPSTLSGWVMFTGVYDGLNVKLYINGSLVTNTVAYSTKTPMYYNANNCVFIGAEAGGNANNPAGLYFNGKISDFRVYATALSDEDILELYKVSMSIDDTGKVHAMEYREG